MTTRIKCPSCGVSLKLKSLDILKRGVPCPGCKVHLPTSWPPKDEEPLEADIIEIVEDDERVREPKSVQEKKAPEHTVRVPSADVYLRPYSPGITIRECWWGSHNPIVIVIVWLLKILRISFPSSTNDPPVTTLEPFQSTFDSFSKSARKAIEPSVLTLRELGFLNPILHNISHAGISTDYHIVTVGHKDGRAMARLQRRYWKGVRPHQTSIVCSFITPFNDGTFLVTTDEKPDMTWPESIDLHRDTKAGVEQLWEQHQETLAEDARVTSIRRVRDRADAIDILEEHHQTLVDFHTDRGAFKPASASQQKKIAAALTPSVAGPESESNREQEGSEHADVMAEIEKQQNGQSSWVTGLVIAIVSAAFFLGLGAARWDWKLVLVILPILFVHELGHYVAMKAFGYRNLKMFFIPLFGAAVTGRNYNVAGWKKVVVSLAGPVPGIVLGSVIGVYGLWKGIDLAVEVAVMAMILNGLNLLPVLPLDGGWVAHSLFFSRHYAVDVAFRILTAIVLIGVSVAVGDRFLIGLGVVMVLAIPTVLRSGRIIHRLKGQVPAVSADEQNIPPATAERIIDEIQEEFPAGSLNPKLQAQVTLDIFQSLNTAVPGVLSTLTLSAIHAGSILCAVVMLSVFIVGQTTDFKDLLNIAMQAPETPYECGSTEVVAGANADAGMRDSNKEVCVVASFDDAGAAESTFTELSDQVPAAGTLRLFGQTLLLALPVAEDEVRDTWIDNLEAMGADVVVRSDDFAVPFSIMFISKTEEDARKIHTALQLHFDSVWASASLIPPWSPNRVLTDEHIKARRTLRKLQGWTDEPDGAVHEEEEDAPDEEEAEEEPTETSRLYEEIAKARKRGNTAKVDVLQKKIAAINEAAEKSRIDGIRDLGPDVVHLELIDIYLQQPKYVAPEESEDSQDAYERLKKDRKAWLEKMAPFLGQLPMAAGEAKPFDRRFAAASGYTTRAGQVHQISGATLHREVDGVPAITDWLCNMGCLDVKYRFGH